MSQLGVLLFYVGVLCLVAGTSSASPVDSGDYPLSGANKEHEMTGPLYQGLSWGDDLPSEQRGNYIDGTNDDTRFFVEDVQAPAQKRNDDFRAMLIAARRARNAAEENLSRPKIPADLMAKIIREVEQRRRQGRLNMEDENALPEILSEISPSRSYVSVGLDLKAISRMIAERQLEKFRRLHGANHQKLLKIGK